MKLRSINISHMHQIKDTKKYDLEDISYLIGPNGSGKSTVLQAIQLAILGYIPGYDKTNAGVMKHSSDGNSISVTAEFDDGSSINRVWMKEKNSVKTVVKAVPENFDPAALIDEIEVPIFNFNEFKDKTANKLKEWFINFLPKDEFDIDWKEYLTSELGSRSVLLSDELMQETLDYIAETSQTLSGVDLVKSLNEWFKSQQSYQKSQVTRLQDTINSMIYYSDIEDADEDEVRVQLSEKQQLKYALVRYEATEQSYQKMKADFDAIDVAAIEKEHEELHSKLAEANANVASVEFVYVEKNAEYSKLSMELCQFNIASSDICPYTKTKCAEMSTKVQAAAAKRSEITAKMNNLQEELVPLSAELKKYKDVANALTSSINMKNEELQYATVLKNRLNSFEIVERPTTDSVDMIDCDLKELEDKLIKISANKQFKELNDTITKEKYKSENAVEVLKIWVNSTGANGLQTYMMDKPFKILAEDMSIYLSSMFGTESTASFHLEEKANSFSFGMMRGNDYVEFDLLSSGEKCLFTIAMMMCLINKSSTSLKLILADDILDHLDADNATRLFSGLADKGIQFIMAGVKECTNNEICIKIGG